MRRSDEGFDIRGGFINGTDEEEVPEAVRCVRHVVMCTMYDHRAGATYT